MCGVKAYTKGSVRAYTRSMEHMIVALLLSLGSFALSGLALQVARTALRETRNGQSPQTVVRAFKQLEDDFEKMSATVHSELGRISRLKRTTLDMAKVAGILEPASTATETGATGHVEDPSPLPIPVQSMSPRQQLMADYLARNRS